MANWKDRFVWSVSIITAFSISGALSCICQMTHPQQHVCQADFVFKGKVLGKWPLSQATPVFTGQYEYRIQVQRVFKGQMQDGVHQEVKLITPASEALCGLPELTDGQTYIITGRVGDDGMQLSMCNWVADWSALTRSQRQGIKHMYQKYCSRCEIRISVPAQIAHPFPQGPLDYFQGCSYSTFATLQLGTEDCEAQHSSCVQHHHGSCSWLSNDAYQACVENRETEMEVVMADQKLGYLAINHGGGHW